MREPSTHHLPGHKIVRSHSLIWSDSTRSLTKNRKGRNLDGIHISKSLSFDVLGVGIGELLRDGVQTTSNNLNRWHRTNSSTSSGTGMDALKTLDKQPLGHKNKRKMMNGHWWKNAMIFFSESWFNSVEPKKFFGCCRVHCWRWHNVPKSYCRITTPGPGG